MKSVPTHAALPPRLTVFALALAMGLTAMSCGDTEKRTDISLDVETTDTNVPPDIGPDTGDTGDTGDTADTLPSDTGEPGDISDTTGADTPDAPPSPGEFGAPCETNNDCLTALCIDSNQGPICTRTCVEECPSGWNCLGVATASDVIFLCVPRGDRLCQPCARDSQCGSGLCLTFDEGARCSAGCDTDEDCPSGYSCDYVRSELSEGHQSFQCVPIHGSCECLPGQDGLQRPCNNQNEAGTCWGVETCLGADGWSACSAPVPSAEVCDGLDNDCNRVVDESLSEEGTTCEIENELGSCQGTLICSGEGGFVCNGQTPAAETCNYQDDDCDGTQDEDFRDLASGLYATDQHCGVCGNDCTGVFPNATAGCAIDPQGSVARCVVTGCAPGFYQAGPTTCLPVVSANCLPCTADSNCVVPGNACVALDGQSYCAEDCGPANLNNRPEGTCAEGYTCTTHGEKRVCLPDTRSCDCLDSGDAGKARPCTEDNAFGTCGGTQVCDPASGGYSSCTARVPGPEVCNGLDDDCDGQVDEAVTAPAEPCAITNANGTCSDSWRCDGESGWICPAQTPAAETCNFNDDDCDGTTDEGFVDADSGQYLTSDHCGLCGRDCDDVILFSDTTECQLDGGRAVCVATTCDEGYYLPPGTNRVCIPTSGAADCSPCAEDAQCAELFDGRCSTVDGARVCTRGCSTQNDCGSGFQCVTGRCLPVSRSCSCREGDAGQVRACANSNATGTCTGVETCFPDATPGWSACTARTPAAEQCNGQDDNCDGRVDELLTHNPTECEVQNAFGTCSASYRCAGVGGWQCPVATPIDELCNYQDDNCNDAVDETFKNAAGRYVDDQHCGVCGNACEGKIPNATATCRDTAQGARCEVQSCLPGFYQVGPLTCLPAQDATCTPCITDQSCPTPGDRCLDLDGGRFCGRDCAEGNRHGLPAGQCDAGYSCLAITSGPAAGASQCVPTSGSCTCLPDDVGDTRTCQSDNALGTCFGAQSCGVSGWGTCSARTPAAETCNGTDDDCDGSVDEALSPPAQACQNTVAGVGTCVGSWTCTGEDGWSCNARTPSTETCDFVDNDCDGSADEDFKTSDQYTALEHCGSCGISCAGVINNGTATCAIGPNGAPRCEVATCDAGYFRASATSCAPVVDATCSVCATDADCRTPGDRCLTLGSERVCGRDCSAGNLHGKPAGVCDPGFACTAVAGGPNQCAPTSGTCSCLPANAGQSRPCSQANANGTCFGTETCNTTQGWVGCTARTPAAETCNGVDDDCDGSADEQLTHQPATCSSTVAGVGTCTANYSCQGESGWQCQAQTPLAELCDYLDNDCDGASDEAFKDAQGRYVSDQHCGACGISCQGAIPNATTTCRVNNGVPRCEVATCNTGYYQAGPLTCLPATDNTCTPCLTDANCQNPGDKCLLLDGVRVCGKDCAAGNIHGAPAGVCPTGFECQAIDGAQQCVPRSRSCACLAADDGETRSCGRQNVNGQCFGTQSCSPAFGWTQCSAQVPAAETCNFIDDDCNGLVDEVAGRGNACTNTNGFGTCTGVLDCLPGFPALQCAARTPAAERCDYVDNDCDGTVDEGYADLGTTCFVGNGACRRFGVRVCSADGSGTECNAIAGTPTAEVCDGVDNDCDNQVDENPAWAQKGTPCTLGDGVCQVTGVYQCSANGQSVVCSQTPPTPAVSTEQGLCNNLDDNCDGDIDEFFDNKGDVCSVGQGVCRAFGNFVCAVGGASTVCDASPLPSSGEVCDLLDNDCDGATDETFKNGQGQYATATTCGNCFTNCQAIYMRPNGYGVCDATGAPTCKLQCCRAGDGNAACDGGNWYDLNAVPDDGCELRLDPDAIYVSTSDPLANNVQGCGRGPRNTAAGAFPCKTIGFGLSEAVRVNRSKVLVADGLYTETVTLVAGKQILGGHRADTWERSVAGTNTTLRGPATVTGHAKTVIADGITTATVFEGFIVYGGSAFGFSANSYAFWIRNSNANLVIRNNLVFGGDAGDGAEGSAGSLGTDGGSGQPGERTIITSTYNNCTNAANVPGNVPNCFDSAGNLVPGACGSAGTNTCGGTSVAGGAGRGAICPVNNTRQGTGFSGSAAPNGGTAGTGGIGGTDRYSDNCGTFFTDGTATASPGTDGGRGADRPGGNGCSGGVGSVSASEWVGAGGAAGSSGYHGGGGGGGGAGGGADVRTECSGGDGTDDMLGGSGGGGGAGGCGGAGGNAGTGGGGAFVFFITYTTTSSNLPTLSGNVITRGRGGGGGNGGIGGKGGRGGEGGAGGIVAGRWDYAMGQGGRGGQGGDGGHGGGGGGGCGGASYGVFVHNITGTPGYLPSNTFVLSGAGGAGGAGGASPGVAGANGSDGVSADVNY